MNRLKIIFFVLAMFALFVWAISPVTAAKKPNILVIFGDDVGMYNISAYHRGMMGGARRTLTELQRKALFSLTITLNRAVPPVVQPLLPDNILSGPGS